jgi:hypothetical protein
MRAGKLPVVEPVWQYAAKAVFSEVDVSNEEDGKAESAVWL